MISNSQPIKNSILESPTGVLKPTEGSKMVCTWCRKPITEFRDLVSYNEWLITGMCQKEQDEFFAVTQEEVL